MRTPPKKFVPEPYEYHQEVELTVDTLTNLGVGLGRDNGWVIMVPFALPGEKVRVRIYRNHKNYSDADLIEVLEPSPERVVPKCPLFGECGGCQYQNLSYSAQLEWKRQQIVELLERLAGVEAEVSPTFGSPKEYYYRSKLTPHYPKPRDESFPIGFLKQGTRNQIVDVAHCPIATDNINNALPRERDRLHANKAGKKRGGTLLLRDSLEGVITDNKKVVSQKVGELIFQFPAGDFFQNNPFILPHMVEHVLSEAKADGVEYLIDAYCGVGLFGICGASKFEQCASVEVNPQAIDWAKVNAELNKVNNCDFVLGEAEAIFEKITYNSKETAVIIDPPRKGCDEVFINQLLEFSPARIVYVSCEPSTQARDLKFLLAAGYKIKTVQPFDLFPQTRHIENVVTLVGDRV